MGHSTEYEGGCSIVGVSATVGSGATDPFCHDGAQTRRTAGETLNDLIADCYDAGIGAQPWDRFLARLGGVLDCAGAVLMMQSNSRRECRVLASAGSVPAWVTEGPAADLLGRGRTAGHEAIECWFGPHGGWSTGDRGHARALSGVAPNRSNDAIGLRAWRNVAANPFNEADNRLLAELVPHVGRALDIHRFRQGGGAEEHPVRSVIDRLTEAVFIVDADGRVVNANREADSMVKSRCGWQIVGDRLMPSAARFRDAFRQSLDLVFSKDESQGGARIIRLALIDDITEPPVPVAVTRLDRSSRTDDLTRPLAAVFSKDPTRQSAVLTPELATVYQLTPSEARLAGMIVNGSSLIDAAASLNVSKNTARSHMKRIYLKTCTQNHADLVRTLSRSFLPLLNDDSSASSGAA